MYPKQPVFFSCTAFGIVIQLAKTHGGMEMTNEERIDLKREIEEQDGCKYSDELFYTGEGDLLDTAEGRAKFCRLNETTVFRKKDPTVWKNYIWVFNNQGVGMTIKRQSHVDPQLMECIDYDANGNEIGKAYEPT